MRSILAVLIALSASAARAEVIASSEVIACRDTAVLYRAANAGLGGDDAGSTAILTRALRQRECRFMDKGERVRVEKTEKVFSCVAPMGSADDCIWVQSDMVRK